MKVKFYIIGDTHGYLEYMSTAKLICIKEKYDALIVCGDLGWFPQEIVRNKNLYMFIEYVTKQKKIPVYFVEGNHEDIPDIFEFPIEDDGLRHLGPALFHIPRGSVVDIKGVKVFGFGGGHSIDQHMRVEGVSWWREEVPSYEETGDALDSIINNDIDLVITHDVPMRVKHILYPGQNQWSTVPKLIENFVEPLKEKEYPITWCTGHYHYSYKQQIDNINFMILNDHPKDGYIFEKEV